MNISKHTKRIQTRTQVAQGLNTGFSVIEFMLVLAVIGLLTMIALPSYQDYTKRTDINTAKSDIYAIGLSITNYQLSNGKFPTTLAKVGADGYKDPWGRPYEYVSHEPTKTTSKSKGKGGSGGIGKFRKDKNLNPINSDFDLYSIGEDGKSSSPLTAKPSHDDIIRANDGKFVGLAEDY